MPLRNADQVCSTPYVVPLHFTSVSTRAVRKCNLFVGFPLKNNNRRVNNVTTLNVHLCNLSQLMFLFFIFKKIIINCIIINVTMNYLVSQIQSTYCILYTIGATLNKL